MKPRPGKPRKGNRRRGDKHVRLHYYEMATPAYRTLSCEARALLVEFRSLYNGAENRIHMSVREIMDRLGVSQRPAQQARDELLDRGWILLLEAAAFHRKVPHAPTYALTSEPLTQKAGDVAPKTYMRWQPSVAECATDNVKKLGSGKRYRSVAECATEGIKEPRKRGLTVAECATDIGVFEQEPVAESATQLGIPRGRE